MKTHRFDAVSFIAGLAFAILGLVFLVPDTPQELIDALVNSGGWFWPVALLIVGLAVIVPVLLPKKEEAIEAGDSD
ncbi:MAG TPA: hypothetical protein VI193_11980 [Acidimicrobiia bacterium]